MIEVSIQNVLLGETYPRSGRGVMAVLDTGYSGFLFVPETLFEKLRLHDLTIKKVKAGLADGSSTELTGSFGSIRFPSLNLQLDGLIETTKGAAEILIGMEGVRRLLIELDCCRRELAVQDCSSSDGSVLATD